MRGHGGLAVLGTSLPYGRGVGGGGRKASPKEPVRAAIAECVKQFLLDRRLQNLSHNTIDFYERALGQFLRFCEQEGVERLDQLDRSAIRSYLVHLQSRPRRSGSWHNDSHTSGNLSAGGISAYLRGLKAFLNWCAREGLALAELPSALPNIRQPHRIMETFSEEQLAAVFKQPDCGTFVGLRNYTMMVLAADSGVRLSELAGIHLEDLDFENQRVKILGKGNKERYAYFGKEAMRALRRFIIHRGREGEWLFCNRFLERVDTRTFQDALKRYAKRAGIEPALFTPHNFRRFFAKQWVRAKGDAIGLMRALGHTTVTMALRYCGVFDDEDLRNKHRALSPMDRMFERNGTNH